MKPGDLILSIYTQPTLHSKVGEEFGLILDVNKKGYARVLFGNGMVANPTSLNYYQGFYKVISEHE